MEQPHTISVREGISVSALQTPPENPADIALVYAPGAGSSLNDPFGAYLAAFLEARGIECWRFQFPYSEAGRKAPDPPALLEETWRAVIDYVGKQTGAPDGGRRRLIIGGRSMGGRIASMVAAKGAPIAGLVLFAYPLIPPGRTTSDRAEHFPSIEVPVLFCSGTRDAFGTPAQLREAVSRVPDAALHFLEGADHGFATLKSSGRSRQAVWQEASEALMAFVSGGVGR